MAITDYQRFHPAVDFSYKPTSGGWSRSSTMPRTSRRRESERTRYSNNRSRVFGEKPQNLLFAKQKIGNHFYVPSSRRKTLDESEWSSCAKSGEISFLQSQIAQEQQQDMSGEAPATTSSAETPNGVSQSVVGLNVQASVNQVYHELFPCLIHIHQRSFIK